MKSKARWLIAGALVAVAVVVALIIWSQPSQDGDDYTVRVGYKPNSGYQIYFVAQSQGLFDKHRVKVEGITFKSTNQMLQALALDQLDATAAGSLEVAASLIADNPNALRVYFTLVFSKDNAFFSIVVPPESGIQNLADLSGKKVAVLPGSTASSWLKVCLKAEGVEPSSVELVQMSPNLQLQASDSGQVDALYTMDPLVTMAKVKGLGHVVVKGPENKHIMNPMANAGGMISTEFLKKHPNVASRFCAAMYEAIDFMRANPEDTRKIIAEGTKLDVSVANQMDLIEYWKLGETNFESVQKYLDFLVEHDIIKTKVSARSLYIDASALK